MACICSVDVLSVKQVVFCYLGAVLYKHFYQLIDCDYVIMWAGTTVLNISTTKTVHHLGLFLDQLSQVLLLEQWLPKWVLQHPGMPLGQQDLFISMFIYCANLVTFHHVKKNKETFAITT